MVLIAKLFKGVKKNSEIKMITENHKTTLSQVLFVVLEKNALKTSKIFSIQIFGHTEVVESSQTKMAKVGTRSLSKLIDLCQEIHRKLFASSLGNFRKPTFRPIDFESVSVST